MKTYFLFLAFVFVAPSAFAQTCAEKIAVVDMKIANAKVHKHTDQLKGLEKELAEVKASCPEKKSKPAKNEKTKVKDTKAP